jgi:hypothetical protein
MDFGDCKKMKLLLGLILGLLIGCSTTISGLLRFQDRELIFHPDKPGVAYPHIATVCVERKKPWKFMGLKCHKEEKLDFYDVNIPEVRKQIVAAGFRCKSPARFKY